MPNVQDIIDYEEGEMEWERMIEFFQEMIDSGIVWSLQGSYGRTAHRLIVDGHCVAPNQKEKE
tara:strand:+ start:565 stop:753 length:189 start_codon:yes stop_codon:yes gene_type:complete